MNKLSRLFPLFLMVACIVAIPDTHAQTNGATLEVFSKSQSLERLKEKAEKGDAEAQHALAFRFYQGDGLTKDLAAAARWYRKAAEQGFATAQCELGTLYVRGEGVDKSDVEAVKWFRKSAEQGDSGAQVALGLHYEAGRGVEKDDTQAFKWYSKAAEQGDLQGQVGLATLYQKGQGVAKDYVEALRWYRNAADHGSATGQAYSGMMYAMGQGAEKNLVEAYAYLSLAVMSGFAEVGQLRDAVGKHLSEEQLSNAQKRIAQLKAEFPGCGHSVPVARSTDIAVIPLSFYVVTKEKIEGGRFIDMAGFQSLGYIATNPDLIITNLEAVHPDLMPRRDVFVDENGKETAVPVSKRASLIIRMLPDDAKQFTKLTEKATGKQVLIMLGGTPLIAPTILAPVSNQDIGLDMGLDLEKMKTIEARLEKLVKQKAAEQ